jgi:alanine racemase
VPDVLSLLESYHATTCGLLTHYSSATNNPAQTKQEYELFLSVVQKFREAGHIPKYVHASNSAATVWHEEQETNLVRLGLAAYGLQPNSERPLDLKPVMSWSTRLVAVAPLAAGQRVGYGGRWVAERKSTIGIIPVGYSDGLRRSPHRQQYVLGSGRKLPIIGDPMMNHTAIDLTHIKKDFKVGEEIVILGTQGAETITSEMIADSLGTINEEVVTTISSLIIRYYR